MHIDEQRLIQQLHKLPFLVDLTADELVDVCKACQVRQYGRNEIVLHESQTTECMYIVHAGRLKVVHTTSTGKERLLAIHRKGESFGEMALLDGQTAPATVIAQEESVISFIRRADFQQYFLGNPKVVQRIISLLSSRLREAWLMLRINGISNAEDRVRAVLAHLVATCGVKDSRGTILDMRLTHQDIAGLTILARETVSRLLSQFAREGEVVLLDGRRLLLTPHFFQKAPTL